MFTKAFEILFYIFTVLSFSATSYTPPWTSSSMELFSFLALFFLFFSLPIKSHKLVVSESFIFSIICLIAAWTLFLFHEHETYEKIWMFSLYVLAFSLYVNCVSLKEEEFYSAFAVSILFAALFNAFVILSQYFDIGSDELGIWVAEYNKDAGRPYGNFGQPNLVSTLILMGLCFSVFLHSRKIIGFYTLILIGGFLGSTLALPSSKTALLCLLVITIVSIFFRDKKSFLIFLLAFVFFLFIKFIAPNTRNLVGADLSTGRFELWETMLYALKESPWSGYGALNARIAHFQVRELDLVPRNQVIGASHNLFLDYLIWFGIFFGIFICFLFVKLIFNYIKRGKSDPSKIYLIFPVLIHSLLEYPLYYANFLFAFAFFIGLSSAGKDLKKYKKLPFLLMTTIAVLLYPVVFDYINVSKKYTEFRFFRNNFYYAEKPMPIDPLILDLTAGQLNILLKEEINDENDLKYVIKITKSMPAFKNFQLIIKYMMEKNYPKDEIEFWMGKAQASFNEKEVSVLKNIK
ncbi:Wzy polymerase domain-containing protein [Comamonas thiooxydans]|uniref:Wzy polymerase domain-containing protein n=1 Tax=Comamonas thiooxydans TaxID=363952 RepID=A0AA42PYY6_9BURK|nr:Wzy polymerase domain-containing protein [Comamonas thiooxydans]MDH1332811.1 Wzy polymerase domain-containing protein [Comamonas thiooxydans]MDH1739823.1 Wzy polymerase domain-containing protein [Comamonas thiooxydans]MDH1785238.1 Wzy polymerase domain-containing protein [Comamonas thiooxydans]